MQIHLGKDVPKKILSPERGNFAFIEILTLSIFFFAATIGLSYGFAGFTTWMWGKQIPISTTYAGTVLVVSALFLQQLVDSAKQRFSEDQSAAGVLNNA